MRADRNLLKSVWECSDIKLSRWKILHPSDTEDERNVGISSEDKAEGLEDAAGVARCGLGVPAALEAQPAPAPAQVQVAADEVVIKKRALKHMKQQVLALLRGEDLPEGAQAREIAEVPYKVPVVPRGETSCPVCKKVFKTHHRVKVHMGVHWGEKFPCGKCGKVLATKRYWTEHTQSCVHGKRAKCPVCQKLFASAQTMHKHHKAQHGADSIVPPGGFVCPFCAKVFQVKKTWTEHKPYCSANPDRKGPYYCRVVGCVMADHPFIRICNLNVHMWNAHGWKERQV